MADDKLLTKGGHLIVHDGKLVTVDNGCCFLCPSGSAPSTLTVTLSGLVAAACGAKVGFSGNHYEFDDISQVNGTYDLPKTYDNATSAGGTLVADINADTNYGYIDCSVFNGSVDLQFTWSYSKISKRLTVEVYIFGGSTYYDIVAAAYWDCPFSSPSTITNTVDAFSWPQAWAEPETGTVAIGWSCS